MLQTDANSTDRSSCLTNAQTCRFTICKTTMQWLPFGKLGRVRLTMYSFCQHLPLYTFSNNNISSTQNEHGAESQTIYCQLLLYRIVYHFFLENSFCLLHMTLRAPGGWGHDFCLLVACEITWEQNKNKSSHCSLVSWPATTVSSQQLILWISLQGVVQTTLSISTVSTSSWWLAAGHQPAVAAAGSKIKWGQTQGTKIDNDHWKAFLSKIMCYFLLLLYGCQRC